MEAKGLKNGTEATYGTTVEGVAKNTNIFAWQYDGVQSRFMEYDAAKPDGNCEQVRDHIKHYKATNKIKLKRHYSGTYL